MSQPACPGSAIYRSDGTTIAIDAIKPLGAVAAWNKRVSDMEGADSTRIARPGDRIVSVNGMAGDVDSMLEVCRQQVLLKLVVERESEPA